ncbi:arginine N-succinyltransferase [Candidatus Pantoea carbekii]|uniref:arginine N-succinyltransferase n=1 Tax=Candidatus Pantoea carbekii TaxID=1235990 RepID=UPI000618745C|nr:arginine N-succinyltransferase [Candidatus Pantoea carbekii]AKC32607.1 arginine N-succinyltransferase astA [Candidatus Pantoea carbekii]
MLFRPVKESDLSDILNLAARAGVGLTSLPNDSKYLKTRINNSIATFNGNLPRSQQSFIFVLEDPTIRRVVGISAIEAAVGLDEPFYNFRIQKSVRVSRELGIYKNLDLLVISYDFTGHSELCTLFLDPTYQKNGNGLFLSKARFLFIAAHRHLFSSYLFAEMRGVVDEEGRSQFWDALGHHFFDLSFLEADRLTGTGIKTFIAELMPFYPIYISLLPLDAQKVIGKVHPNTVPARLILEKEGFKWCGSVDIFDAGPVLQAETDSIRAIRDTQIVIAGEMGSVIRTANIPCIVSNDRFKDFCALVVESHSNSDALHLSEVQREFLQVNENDILRFITMYPERI